jgi:hypothetical protein
LIEAILILLSGCIDRCCRTYEFSGDQEGRDLKKITKYLSREKIQTHHTDRQARLIQGPLVQAAQGQPKRDVVFKKGTKQAVALQALWHRQTPIIAKVIWEMAGDALQKAIGIDINDDGLESLEVNEIRAALQNHL